MKRKKQTKKDEDETKKDEAKIEEAEDDIRRLKARVQSECGSRLRLAEMLVEKFKRLLISGF